MGSQSEGLQRRSINTPILSQLVSVVDGLVTDDDAFERFSSGPLAFVRGEEKYHALGDAFERDEDLTKIGSLVNKIRDAISAGDLDYDFLSDFVSVKGKAKNYQEYTKTEYNFDKSEESEVNFKRKDMAIRDTKPGWKSETDKRLNEGIDEGFKKIGNGELVLAFGGEEYGPLVSQEVMDRIFKIEE